MNLSERKKAARQYGKNRFAGMSVADKMRLVLSMAVKAATERDVNRTRQAIIVLKKGVNFDEHPTIALGFMQLYVRCEQLLNEGERFDEILKILIPLQRAWIIAEPRKHISIRPSPKDKPALPRRPRKGPSVRIVNTGEE